MVVADDVSPTLLANGHGGSRNDKIPMVVEEEVAGIAENQRGEVVETEYAHALTVNGGKPGQGYAAVRVGSRVRRLTPTECERLQGFPDLWTVLDGPSLAGERSWYELPPGERVRTPVNPSPHGPRYEAMGRAVSVPVAEAIGERLAGW